MLSAFREASGCSRSIVDYDCLIKSPDLVIRKLASDLDLDNDLDELALNQFCNHFIDASSNHCGTTDTNSIEFTPRFISRLETAINRLSTGSLSPDSNGFAMCVEETETELIDRSGLLAYIDSLDNIIIRLRRTLTKIQHQLKDLTP